MATVCAECFAEQRPTIVHVDTCSHKDDRNPLLMSGLAEDIRRIADEKMRLVLANRERFVDAWIAEHGVLPSRCELHETTTTNEDGTLTFATTVYRLVAIGPAIEGNK